MYIYIYIYIYTHTPICICHISQRGPQGDGSGLPPPVADEHHPEAALL